MNRRRSRERNIISHLPLNGCIMFFSVEEHVVRAACSGMGGVVEAHKINGTFLNHTEKGTVCDMYVCMTGNLDE